MQQQQQHADYDLLAVFNDESKADAAESKLHKEGFGDEEVYRLPASVIVGGEFREHRPTHDRSAVFLQTKRSGPRPALVVTLAIVFGLVLALLMFAAHFAFSALPEVPTIVAGAVIGIIVGAIVGLLQRGPVRGAIGQQSSMVSPPPVRPGQDARTVLALRLPDAENISRKSRARAILLNTGGKIDRSVGRRE
ncbi:MAG: hypothetical protein M3Z08_17490 [Chloroflexota bacterium]|nr:hypothetical protein [Chloroflexota bacterium]